MSGAAGTYLERIVADVRADLDLAGTAPAGGAARVDRRSLLAGIQRSTAAGELGIIAEVKRRSPSVGDIAPSADPVTVAAAYADAGAVGVSVLTERHHFSGTPADLDACRHATQQHATPLLRKDFIIDERQLEESPALGADAVLLIAALHDASMLAGLVSRAHELGLEVLMEVHDEQDLARALTTDARIIGINNRDLRSFHVDLAVTERLAPLVDGDRMIVAESGIRNVQDAARMHAAGVHALLVGEALMRAAQPGRLLRELACSTTETVQ